MKRLKSERNYDALLLKAQEASLAYPQEARFWAMLHYAQVHYVKEKLKSSMLSQLEEKKDYRTLIQVYQKLLSIFPESKEIHRLLCKARKKIEKTEQAELMDFYNKAEQQIHEMIKKEEYEKALAATYEILASDPKNKRFIRLLLEADEKLNDQMDKELEIYFKKSKTSLKEEYTRDRSKFIRV